MLRVWLTGFRFLVYRHEPHQPHQAADALSASAVPQRHQITAHLPDSKEWPFGESPVDFLHQCKVRDRFSGSFVIQTGTSHLEQHALPDNAELRMAGIDHALPAGDAHRFPQASAKKSRSTVS